MPGRENGVVRLGSFFISLGLEEERGGSMLDDSPEEVAFMRFRDWEVCESGGF